MTNDSLVIAGRAFHSRLIVGTGKYRSFQEMAAMPRRLRRRHGDRRGAPRQSHRPLQRIAARLHRPRQDLHPPQHRRLLYRRRRHPHGAPGREVGLSNWVKLEVIGDQQDALPGQRGPARSHRASWSEKASWCCPTPTTTWSTPARLVDAGAAAVMPLAAPIGSGMGIQNQRQPAHPPREHHRGASHRGRRRGHRLGRRHSHGTRRRWCAHEYRHRRGGGCRQ